MAGGRASHTARRARDPRWPRSCDSAAPRLRGSAAPRPRAGLGGVGLGRLPIPTPGPITPRPTPACRRRSPRSPVRAARRRCEWTVVWTCPGGTRHPAPGTGPGASGGPSSDGIPVSTHDCSTRLEPLVAAARAVRGRAAFAGLSGLLLTLAIAHGCWWLQLPGHDFGDEGDRLTPAQATIERLRRAFGPGDRGAVASLARRPPPRLHARRAARRRPRRQRRVPGRDRLRRARRSEPRDRGRGGPPAGGRIDRRATFSAAGARPQHA